MIIKVCQFKARKEQGERLVEIFQPGEMEKAAEFFGMGKRAAPMLPEVQSYLDKLRPDPNKIYVLVNALGAGEYWGSNINGDYFPEGSLIHKGPVYGYETFYGAFPYKHHVNKDPSKSFGKVELSTWHDGMKRVELVVSIDRERAHMFGADDVCDKLDAGQFPDVSMGCKVPYDLCSKCLDWKRYREAQATFDPSVHASIGQAVLAVHRRNPIRGLSVTRNDYCEHLSGMLNKILADGTKIYAINDYPRFFDISFVFIGADKTAKVMAKLAFAGYNGLAVPSWYVAEQMGYEQPSTEKTFEKVAASPNNMVLFGGPKHPGREAFNRMLESIIPLNKDKGSSLEDQIDEKVTDLERQKHQGPVNLDPSRTAKAKEALRSTFSMEPALSGIEAVRARLREKRASHRKGAEITKEVSSSQFGGKAVPILPDRPDIPNEVLDSLGSCGLSEALSTPTTMGMILKPREFQRITIIGLGKKPLADQLDQSGTVFSPSEERDESVPMGAEHFSSVLKRILLPFLEDRSMLEPVARRRVIKITMGTPEDVAENKEVVPSNTEESPFLQKISAAYNGYLNRIGDCLSGAEQIVNSQPDLWEQVHGSVLSAGFEKVGSGSGVNPGVVLGAIGGAFALSQIARIRRDRARMGRTAAPVSIVTDLAAEHPGALMFLAGMGALHQQGSSIPRRLVQGTAAAIRGGGASLAETFGVR